MRILALVVVLIINAFSALAVAEERYALVIGNSNYQNAPLRNPRNDATDMAQQLAAMGYQVYQDGPLLDLDRVALERAISRFAGSLPENASVVFYYAGHGMAVRNDNYLIPINHQLRFQEQLPDRTVSLRSVVDVLKNANPEGTNVLLLDACRDNPLVRSFRSAETGLRRLTDIPRGIFVGYAADTGQVAEDGLGRNGTYTEALLNVMAKNPHVIVEIAHKEVAQSVYEKTDGKQFPVSENKVYGNWCFDICKSTIIEDTETDNTPATNEWRPVNEPTVAVKPKIKTWQLVGGVILGAVAVGLALQDNDPTEPRTFQLILTPPQ